MHHVIDIICKYLPYFVEAGDYSLNIQSRVHSQKDKVTKDSTIVSEALTDADLSIQNLFEVVTLAQFPEFRLVPEEIDQSINVKYFDQKSDTILYLDPVNHTRFYKDRSGNFDIILTITRRHEIVGGIAYVPADGIFYIADENQSYVTSRIDYLSPDLWQPLTMENPGSTLLTYRVIPDELELLKVEFDSVIQLDRDYDALINNVSIHDIFTGRIGAFYRSNASIMDWGVLGYIALKAGAVFVDRDGDTMDGKLWSSSGRAASLICAANEDLATRVLHALALASVTTKTDLNSTVTVTPWGSDPDMT